MKYKTYDIKCALTHDLSVCEHCKKCGKDFAKVRIEMAEQVEEMQKQLDDMSYEDMNSELLIYKKALDKACDILTKFMPNALSQTKEQWKDYLIIESVKQ